MGEHMREFLATSEGESLIAGLERSIRNENDQILRYIETGNHHRATYCTGRHDGYRVVLNLLNKMRGKDPWPG